MECKHFPACSAGEVEHGMGFIGTGGLKDSEAPLDTELIPCADRVLSQKYLYRSAATEEGL